VLFHVFAHVVAAPHGFACVGIPATRLYIPTFIEIRSRVSKPKGVKIWHFPLLWLVAFTTACTTVQAVTPMFTYLMIHCHRGRGDNRLSTSPRHGCEVLWSACLYVCLSVRSAISKTTRTSKVHRIFCTRYLWSWRTRGSDLLWRKCHTLCTSGFVDAVDFMC